MQLLEEFGEVGSFHGAKLDGKIDDARPVGGNNELERLTALLVDEQAVSPLIFQSYGLTHAPWILYSSM